MPQAVAVAAVEVGVVVQGVHLVHSHPRQAPSAAAASRASSDGDRLAVGQRHDDLRVIDDVVEDVGRGARGRQLAHSRSMPRIRSDMRYVRARSRNCRRPVPSTQSCP